MDPFLFAHKRTVGPLFDLCTKLNTISVRDQMTRALLLAERLPEWLREQLGVDHQEPVLVVGGGACGMTAAVSLAWQGLKVEVAERDGHLFHLQRNCTSRWLDPTQYDWPLDTWRAQRFPLRRAHHRTPFGWNANAAQQVARKWGQQLSRHWRQGLRTNLRIRKLEAGLRHRYIKARRLLRVQFNNPRTGFAVGRKNYGAVVWAFGHGEERCSLANSPQFRGLPFWHTDRLEEDNCGLATKADEGTVLISGSGDGALQDFLRVVTRRRSVRAIYDELGLDGNIDVHKILSAELRAERAINWSTGAAFAAPYLRELQDCHEEVVDATLTTPGLRDRIRGLVDRRPKQTILVTRQDRFTCLYPLNRFLTLLILRGFNNPAVEWRTGIEVDRVQSIGVPPARPDPTNCIGHRWRVSLNTAQGRPAPHVDANVVLLRHGIESPETTLPPTSPLPRMPRPVPPVHLH